jgi:MFS transporter, AAHS family, 4-hydroxybenzoate transporter
LTVNFAAGMVVIGLTALVAMPYLVLSIVIFVSGLTIIGSQTGPNAACGKLYPARMRTTGIGWGLGVGRLGGIAAPALGGFLLAHGVAPLHIFLCACLFSLIARFLGNSLNQGSQVRSRLFAGARRIRTAGSSRGFGPLRA